MILLNTFLEHYFSKILYLIVRFSSYDSFLAIRYLVKSYGSAKQGKPGRGSVAYLGMEQKKNCSITGDLSLSCLLEAYQHVAARYNTFQLQFSLMGVKEGEKLCTGFGVNYIWKMLKHFTPTISHFFIIYCISLKVSWIKLSSLKEYSIKNQVKHNKQI